MSQVDKKTNEAASIESYLSTVLMVEERPEINDKRLIRWLANGVVIEK